jgi:predicted nucleotidyltransferase
MIPGRLRKELKGVVKELKHRYHPREIILFGSLAKGKGRPDSDIDLVVIKQTRKRFMDRLREVALLHHAHVGVDILVYTPKEWEQLQREGRSFIVDEVLGKGRVLYRAA